MIGPITLSLWVFAASLGYVFRSGRGLATGLAVASGLTFIYDLALLLRALS